LSSNFFTFFKIILNLDQFTDFCPLEIHFFKKKLKK